MESPDIRAGDGHAASGLWGPRDKAPSTTSDRSNGVTSALMSASGPSVPRSNGSMTSVSTPQGRASPPLASCRATTSRTGSGVSPWWPASPGARAPKTPNSTWACLSDRPAAEVMGRWAQLCGTLCPEFTGVAQGHQVHGVPRYGGMTSVEGVAPAGWCGRPRYRRHGPPVDPHRGRLHSRLPGRSQAAGLRPAACRMAWGGERHSHPRVWNCWRLEPSPNPADVVMHCGVGHLRRLL